MNSYLNSMFSAACLYAATLFIYGMLSLHQAPFGKRKEALTKMYGTPLPDGPKHANLNRLDRAVLFSKHFFLRPNFVMGVMMGMLVIRNYSNPIISCVLAFGISAVMLTELHKYETKFIPLMSIAIGVIYGAAHMIGYYNDWHHVVEATAYAIVNHGNIQELMNEAVGKVDL